jgi:hypothetical protein
MTTKQFVIRFISVSFLLLILIALFNRIVDPFWYFRDIEIKGFNAVKLEFRNYERHVKPHWLVREQPEAIILGSSFAEIGFDPTNPFFTDHGRLKGMNFAFSGASWKMVQCQFEFAVTHAPIKRALIGFHPENLPVADCAKDFAALGQTNMGELLLSMPSLGASIKTIRKQKTGKPSHTREGRYFALRDEPGVDILFGVDYRRRVKQKEQCSNAINTTDIPFNSVPESAFDLSGLRKMIRIAQEQGVELVLYAYPHHVYNEEWDRQCGDEAANWHAMKQIASLIEAEAAPDQARAWQFYGYNEFTTEPIGTSAKYWQDSRHFNFEVGDMMLADMFNGTRNKPEFGRPLVSGNIEADYEVLLQERAEYLQHHPEFHADLQKLQQLCSDQTSKCLPLLQTLGLAP